MGSPGTTKKFKQTTDKYGQKKSGRGGIVYAVHDNLKEIHVYVDEKELKGAVSFVPYRGDTINRALLYTWFPEGSWQLILDSDGKVEGFIPSKNIHKEIVQELNNKWNHEIVLLQWISKDDAEKNASERILRGTKKRNIPLHVSYSRDSSGNIDSIKQIEPLTDRNDDLLKDPNLALIYLLFIEHFAGIKVDFQMAKNGISKKELSILEKMSPECRIITNYFTQGFREFQGVQSFGGVNNLNFMFMEETILHQYKRKNPLAIRNMLRIGQGILRQESGSFKDDVGILRRGESKLILYDKFGRPVRAYIGYMDIEYKSVELTKVPHIKITINDRGIYLILKSLEQTFGDPNRELYMLAINYYKYSKFITDEMNKRFGKQIADKIITMAPIVITFFIAHAFILHFATKGHPVAAVLAVLFQAAGIIFGVDYGLKTVKKLLEAGYHFNMLETIGRDDPKSSPKSKLTGLSEFHFMQGATALIDGMSDIISMGIVLIGSISGVKVGKSFLDGLKAPKSKARVEITVENGKAKEIKSTDSTKTVEIINEPKTHKIQKGRKITEETDGKSPRRRDTLPLEDSNAGVGKKAESKVPKEAPTAQVDVDVALGLHGSQNRGTPMLLIRFAEKLKAVTWNSWKQMKLCDDFPYSAGVSWKNMFLQAMSRCRRIKFNLTALDQKNGSFKAALERGKNGKLEDRTGYLDVPPEKGLTEWELYTVYSRAALRAKTDFYLNGKLLTEAEVTALLGSP